MENCTWAFKQTIAKQTDHVHTYTWRYVHTYTWRYVHTYTWRYVHAAIATVPITSISMGLVQVKVNQHT